MFGKWRGSVGGTIELAGATGRAPYRTTIDVAQAAPDEGHRALRHLWARTRIANLSDFGVGDPDEQRVAHITSLGLTYSLLTRYTSFIAVHEVIRRTQSDADDVDQPSPMPEGVSDLAVGAEPELLWVLAALLAVIALRVARVRLMAHAEFRVVVPRRPDHSATAEPASRKRTSA